MNSISPRGDATLSVLLSAYVINISSKNVLDTQLTIGDEVVSTNWQNVKRKYSAFELEENNDKYLNGDYDDILIKNGTLIYVSTGDIKRDISHVTSDIIIKNTEYKPFISKKLEQLLRDPSYIKHVDSHSGEKLAIVDNNDITVYIWCRALTAPGDNSQSGTWINISAFVQQITTTVSDQGGGFSFILPPLQCKWSEGEDNDLPSVQGGYLSQGGWELTNVNGYSSGDVRDDYVSQSSLIRYNDKDYVRQNLMFNTVLQENDLVYIKFEKLPIDIEKVNSILEVNGRIHPSQIANQVWDMIGLIDSVSLATVPTAANINVSGRDLMKVLVEDGSYFFPEQFALNIFRNEGSLLSKRNVQAREGNAINKVVGYTFKTIETILKYIFNKFSNLGVVPNNAFNGYGSDLKKEKFQIGDDSLKEGKSLNDEFVKEDRQGVYRIIDLVFDPQIKDRVLADNTISQDNGSIINSIRNICQDPFVEFTGDTYGDKYNFIVRKPPFDEKGYKGLVYDDIMSEQEENVSILKDNGLSIDSNKLKRKFDNRIKKDTIGRKDSFLSDLVIEIDDIDVLSNPQLTYHNEAYSWYRLVPRGLGLSEIANFTLAPVVPFDEYAKIWGNKTFSLEYNYAPTEYILDSNSDKEREYAERQSFYDLQFCIQSHAYLPFTRRGTIVLTGNRTIKRGLFIYFKPTKEVFYVDSVTHSRSMSDRGNERSTVLQVSRGMREKYIKGVDVPGIGMTSYFNIINTKVLNNTSINNTEFLKNWVENVPVFNFFVQRRQWAD